MICVPKAKLPLGVSLFHRVGPVPHGAPEAALQADFPAEVVPLVVEVLQEDGRIIMDLILYLQEVNACSIHHSVKIASVN